MTGAGASGDPSSGAARHLLPQGAKKGRSAIAKAISGAAVDAVDARRLAIARARSGLDWSYPCLIWVMDYVAEATGRDPAEAWRNLDWDEATARRELGRAAVAGVGETAVERALDAAAKREGWAEAEGSRQGAVMIGVFTAVDGIGVPAIFDGQDRWIVSNTGRGVTSLAEAPKRIWEIDA